MCKGDQVKEAGRLEGLKFAGMSGASRVPGKRTGHLPLSGRSHWPLKQAGQFAGTSTDKHSTSAPYIQL